MVRELAKSVHFIKSLKVLNLSHNAIECISIKCFADSIEKNGFF